ncbi:hypothetical protein [Actinoplanes sp. NPDC049265]|uniref:hypothetical protein n=1 Tax=Actinoplanes sp. NPDC049265 TaxID=3363902 RepID=UPI0037194284
MLDTLQCRSPSTLVEDFARVKPSFERGAQHAAHGRLHDALSTWGVDETTADRLCEDHRALTFHSLLETLRRSLAERDAPSEDLLWASVSAARLAEAAMAGPGSPTTSE